MGAYDFNGLGSGCGLRWEHAALVQVGVVDVGHVDNLLQQDWKGCWVMSGMLRRMYYVDMSCVYVYFCGLGDVHP